MEQALTAARALAPKVLPEYMNPGAMNPKQFQNIQAKRKMLWSKSKSKQVWKTQLLLDKEIVYFICFRLGNLGINGNPHPLKRMMAVRRSLNLDV